MPIKTNEILKHELNCGAKEKINTIEKEVILFNQTSKMMQEDITDIKLTLKTFIEKADEKYATKVDLSKLSGILWSFAVVVVLGMGWFIWTLFTDNILWK